MSTTTHEVPMPKASEGSPENSTMSVPSPAHGAEPQHRSIHLTRRMTEVVMVVALAVAGGVLMGVGNSAQSTINTQLTAEGLRFPPTGPTFNSVVFPKAAGYAGKLVATGPLAEVYASGYLAPAITMMTGGKTAAEVSALAMANPTNATLQAQAAQIFEASTTKGLLLNAWGWSRLGSQMLVAGVALLLGALLLLGIAIVDVATGEHQRRRPASK